MYTGKVICREVNYKGKGVQKLCGVGEREGKAKWG